MLIAYLLLFIIIALLVWETAVLRKNVQNIPLRILVNGTRGKSSVSEYIAAGLRNSGKPAMAKITGVEPTLIFEDGQKELIKRRSGPRVQEQIQIIHKANHLKTSALCLECMSITPEYQKLESRLFKPQFYVITNINDDHREKMGHSVEEQARAMCEAIPPNCTVISNEVRFIDIIRDAAEKQGSRVLHVSVPEQPFADFPLHVFSENINLALKVCELAGCVPEKALTGIRAWALQKKSPLSVIKSGQKKIQFLDGFDVNDVSSAQDFILHWQEGDLAGKSFSILLNTRADRPTRSVQFARWIAGTVPNLQQVILSGTHIKRTEKELLKAGMEADRIFKLYTNDVSRLRAEVLGYVKEDALVVGLGNISGLGLEFRKMLVA